MWVRIQEVSFPAAKADDAITHVRDTAVLRFDGDGFRGFRLLVDRPNGRALEVSYWDSEDAVFAAEARDVGDAADLPDGTILRTNYYELAVDSA